MMNRFASPPTSMDESFSMESWRVRFLNRVLQVAAILAFGALVFYLLIPAPVLLKIAAVGAYTVLVYVTLAAKLLYRIRAGALLVLFYAAGLSVLGAQNLGAAGILFVGLITLTGLLFPQRAAVSAVMAITLLSILIFGVSTAVSLMTVGALAAVFFLVSGILALAVQSMQEEFARKQDEVHRVFDSLQQEHLALERKAEESSAGLARKAEHLRATSYIARKTAEVQDLSSLLKTVVDLVTDQFGFYHTGIFIISESGNQVVLQAASSEGGQRMVEKGHALSVGTQGIVGYVAAQKKPRIALDVGTDAVFFNNPDLPMTRSEVALPLLIRDKVLGVLDIQSDKPQAFSMDDIDVFQTLSDQIAIAIENARLLDETQAAIVQLEALTRLRTHEAWRQKVQERRHVFTYTPLGLRAEKLPQNKDNSINAPIVLRGRRIGSISIARKGEARWSKLDQGLLDEVAGQVGLALENIRLLEEATRRARQEQMVGNLATRFSQSLDLDTLLQTAARELGQLPQVSEVSVFIGQPNESVLQPNEQSGAR